MTENESKTGTAGKESWKPQVTEMFTSLLKVLIEIIFPSQKQLSMMHLHSNNHSQHDSTTLRL